MAVMKEKCPICGGTIIIAQTMTAGECDSCGTQFSLSDLQKMKEASINAVTDDAQEAIDLAPGGYRTALSTQDIEHRNTADLCEKTEIALESEQWELAYRYCDEIIRRDPKFAKAYLYMLLADLKIFKKEELANCKTSFQSNENYRLLMRFADPYLQAEIRNYAEQVNQRLALKAKEEKYLALCARMKSASGASQYEAIAKGFSSLQGYKDSEEKHKECLDEYKRLQARSNRIKVTVAVLSVAAVLAVVLIAAALIIGIVWGVNSKKAEYDNSHFAIEITDKSNVDYDNSNVECCFEFNITNRSKHTAKFLKGYMTVKDEKGNVLTDGEVTFRGKINSESESNWTLTWSMSRNDNAARVWNSDFEELEILFRITEIDFEDGTSRKYETPDITVKQYDQAYVEEKYNRAISCYQNGEYQQAKELFADLGDYKDSADWLALCDERIYEAEQQSKETNYQQAVSMLERSDYLGAVQLLREIADYKDSRTMLDQIYENAVKIALVYASQGQYTKAVELLEGLGYTDDWQDANTPDDVYYTLVANKQAIDGMYASLVSLGFVDFVIPDGVTEIKAGAFRDCTSLNSIVIPDSVLSIGAQAFYGCTSLKEVVVPDSVTTLGTEAFCGCLSLSSVTLSANLTAIGDGAFYDCKSLSGITLPGKLSSIGEQAFYACSGLRKLVIPESVTFIGDLAIDKCNNLTELSMPAIDGFELSSMFTFASSSSLVRVNITSGTQLGKRFFYQCTSLSEVNLPEGLEVIGEEAFAQCSATTVNIPDTVVEIGAEAFSRSSIKTFKLPANVTVISESLFAYSKLSRIELHGNLSYIAASAFHDCALTIAFDGTKDEWLAFDKDSLWNSGMSTYKVICTDSTFTHKPGYTDTWL